MEIFNDKRKMAIIGLSALLVILLALIIWWFLQPKKQANVGQGNQATTTVPAVTVEPAIVEPATTAQIQEANSYPLGVKQLAMAFAERYGSYSSDVPVKNIDDLKPYMTDRLTSELTSASAAYAAATTTIFTGYTTKALSTQLTGVSDSNVGVIVKVQRTQTIGSTEKVYYASLKLTAVKAGDEWKIDAAAWQ